MLKEDRLDNGIDVDHDTADVYLTEDGLDDGIDVDRDSADVYLTEMDWIMASMSMTI